MTTKQGRAAAVWRAVAWTHGVQLLYSVVTASVISAVASCPDMTNDT
jgi:hypothetical protein